MVERDRVEELRGVKDEVSEMMRVVMIMKAMVSLWQL